MELLRQPRTDRSQHSPDGRTQQCRFSPANQPPLAATVAALVTSVSTAALAQDTARTLADNEAILHRRQGADRHARTGAVTTSPLRSAISAFARSDRVRSSFVRATGSIWSTAPRWAPRTPCTTRRSTGSAPTAACTIHIRPATETIASVPMAACTIRIRPAIETIASAPTAACTIRIRPATIGTIASAPMAACTIRIRPAFDDRQRSYGGLNDPYPSSDYRNDRQRSYGGLYDPYPSSDSERSPALLRRPQRSVSVQRLSERSPALLRRPLRSVSGVAAISERAASSPMAFSMIPTTPTTGSRSPSPPSGALPTRTEHAPPGGIGSGHRSSGRTDDVVRATV